MGLVPSSYIPGKNIRILREFTRYRSKLVAMRASEKNRYQNAVKLLVSLGVVPEGSISLEALLAS